MDPGTRYATLGTPIGIIVISFFMDDLLEPPLLTSPVMALGMGATRPFFGTNVETEIKNGNEASKN